MSEEKKDIVQEMLSSEMSEHISSTPAPSPDKILLDLLQANGSVSIRKLKSKMIEANILNIDEAVEELSCQTSRWTKNNRSFYTLDKAKQLEATDTEDQAEDQLESDELTECSSDEHESLARRRRNRTEGDLCEKYILPYLRPIYHSEYNIDNHEVAFCVQNERPSEPLRNVDLIAVNWRNSDVAELVTVEVKIEFNARVVQQAANYSRFSHRVWIAVVVESSIEVETMVPYLREEDPLLFEYILALGLGIIACQRRQGSGYECYAIQWPRKQLPDEFEKQNFLASYRENFESAGLLPSQKKIAKVA